MEVIETLFMLIGALGVFLLGMKIMSKALQKVAGSRLKTLLGKMTSNRFSGVLTGFGVTCVVQSSSATTVMVVSFAAAGLLTLTQAIGVIMGANIGTTVTGWLVALLGFKVKITAFALPAIGVGFFLGFVKHTKISQWGEVLMGFGILFLGLVLMKESVPTLDDPEALAWVVGISDLGFGSVLIFVAIGTVLTVVLQSSSATMTLTLTMVAMGWIPYHLAAAMVLGENIGTTATANIAAIGSHREAVRAARAHFIFNIVGVVWALALMQILLLPLVDLLVPGDPNIPFAALEGEGAQLAMAGVYTTHLAAFHTAFNLINTSVMLPLVGSIAKLVVRWVPEGAAKPGRLRHITAGVVATPELMLVQAGQEMEHMLELVREMFTSALEIVTASNGIDEAQIEQTLQKEEITDELEDQIVAHLALAARYNVSNASADHITAMIQNVHRVERIADHCATLVRIARRTREAGHSFSEGDRAELEVMGRRVDTALAGLGRYLAGEGSPVKAEMVERKIDKKRRKLRARHIQRMTKGADDIPVQLAFLDLITHMEEIGDRAVGIVRRAEASLPESERHPTSEVPKGMTATG